MPVCVQRDEQPEDNVVLRARRLDEICLPTCTSRGQ